MPAAANREEHHITRDDKRMPYEKSYFGEIQTPPCNTFSRKEIELLLEN
jgi:hypothetical protein